MIKQGKTVTAKWHLLGSVSGYGTLASHPDLDVQDAKELEILGFGQTDRTDYLSRLAIEPSGLGRRLSSGRYALTRCFEGAPDTAGRRTLLFASLVFDLSDWATFVSPVVSGILNDTSLWQHVMTKPLNFVLIKAANYVAASTSRLRTLEALDTWLAKSSTETLIVARDDHESAQAILQLTAVLPPMERSRISFAIRALSASIPVEICTLADGADWGGRRKLIELQSGESLAHPFAKALASVWKVDQPLPRAFCDGWVSIDSYLELTNDGQYGNRELNDRPSRASIRATVAILLLAMGAVTIAGWLWVRSRSEKNAPAQQQSANSDSVQHRDSTPLETPLELPDQTKQDGGIKELESTFSGHEIWRREDLRQWLVKANASPTHIEPQSPDTAKLAIAIVAAKKVDEWLRDIERLNEQISQELPIGTQPAARQSLYPLSSEKLVSKKGLDIACAGLEQDPRSYGWTTLRDEAITPLKRRLDDIRDQHSSSMNEARQQTIVAAQTGIKSACEDFQKLYRRTSEPVRVTRTQRDSLVATSPEPTSIKKSWATPTVRRAADIDAEISACAVLAKASELSSILMTTIPGVIRVICVEIPELIASLPLAGSRPITSESKAVQEPPLKPNQLKSDPQVDQVWNSVTSSTPVDRNVPLENVKEWWRIALQYGLSNKDARIGDIKAAARKATNARISHVNSLITRLRESPKDPDANSNRQSIISEIDELRKLRAIEKFPETLGKEIDKLQMPDAPNKPPEETNK